MYLLNGRKCISNIAGTRNLNVKNHLHIHILNIYINFYYTQYLSHDSLSLYIMSQCWLAPPLPESSGSSRHVTPFPSYGNLLGQHALQGDWHTWTICNSCLMTIRSILKYDNGSCTYMNFGFIEISGYSAYISSSRSSWWEEYAFFQQQKKT